MTHRVEQLAGGVELHCGDCLDVLATLEPNSIDACVTDPPYHLTEIKTSSQSFGSQLNKGRTVEQKKARAGFMGKSWDGGDIAFQVETWQRVYRILKPGAFLLACGGTRTFHRMACAIEDAGFEIRDMVSWLYSSGFPKSLDVSKAIDKANGDTRPVTGSKSVSRIMDGSDLVGGLVRAGEIALTSAASAASAAWSGFGTALKPACEPIVLARKPLEGTVAQNVLKWGVGALNIDACRVDLDTNDPNHREPSVPFKNGFGAIPNGMSKGRPIENLNPSGRWPANVILDGSDEVVGAFPDAPGQQRFVGPEHGERPSRGIYGDFDARPPNEPRGDAGSAARFFYQVKQDDPCRLFYSAKADSDDRLGSKHPTVKPLDLMQYLCRLVTPPRWLILDCFAGTGTTGEAAFRECMRAVLIEREVEYQDDIRRRMRLAFSGPNERSREAIKAKTKGKPVDDGPLFGTPA